MGAIKNITRGLAAGAMLGAAAALMAKKAKKDPSAKAAMDAAKSVAKLANAHAKTVGNITKNAYESIVENTMAEVRGAKQLSKSEIDELHAELKASWKELSKMMKDDSAPAKKTAKKKATAKKKKKV